MDSKAYWETIYRQRAPTEVSWYQANPDISLALIEATGIGRDAAIIDVGAGASLLVDKLLEAGFTHLTALDISATALQRARERLAEHAKLVTWVEGDVTAMSPLGSFEVWHDRAVFHFLTEANQRHRYLQAVEQQLSANGHLIIATFALSAPPQCSGLPVQRYSPETLRREFGDHFELVEMRHEAHRTPRQTTQSFLYTRFRRVA